MPLSVPNAPCGVERITALSGGTRASLVPNAPCGVESKLGRQIRVVQFLFLMHRVELKVREFDFEQLIKRSS